MVTFVQDLRANIREFFTRDIVYASFWLSLVIVIFFFPVMAGRQSLAEAVPTFYSHPFPNPNVKTPWQVDGGWHTTDVIPLVRTETQLVKEGTPPLWTPYSGGGEPLLMSSPVNVYYPFRLLFFLLWDSVRAFDWYFMLRFFIAGLGMFLYLRAIGLRRIVSLWGGIAYAFTGYFTLYLTYAFLDIDALLPWTLWAIERYCRNKNFASAGLIGFFLAMAIVIGQPQSAIIAFLLAGLYFLWRERFPVVRHSLFIILVALLIASPFIADFLTLASQGKTIASWESKGLLTFAPIQILHFFVTPTMMPEVAASGHLFDRFEIIIPYIGMSVLILFLLSFFIKKKPPELAPFYIWIAFVVLKNAGFPLVQWIGTLPVFNQIGWYKAYGPMAGAMVICAAVSFEHLLRERDGHSTIRWPGFYKCIAGISLLFVAAYVLAKDAFLNAYVPNFDFFSRHPEAIKKVIILLSGFPSALKEFALSILQNHGGYFTILLFVEAALFAAATFAVIHFIRRKSRYAVFALVGITVFELWVYMPKIRDGFQYFDPYQKTPPYVEFLIQAERKIVGRTFSIGNVFNGRLGEVYEIQNSQNHSNIKSSRYFAFLPDGISREHALTGIIQAEELPEIPQKFFDAYSIRYFLSEESLPKESLLNLVYDQDIKIYENKNSLPKAYVIFEKKTAASPEEARSIFYGPSFDPHRSAIMEDGNALLLPNPGDASRYADVTITSYKNNEVDLKTDIDRDGILVLTDLFYPGWQAYLDGKKVTTYPANVMFRGISLPAGSHTVRFVYEPPWFWPTVTLSLLTIAGIIMLLAYSWRRINV